MFEQYSVSETVRELGSDGQAGLTTKEAGERLRRDGRNEMKEGRKKTPVGIWREN